MDSVFSSSFDYFSTLRKNAGFRRSKNMQIIKARNAERIAKGRPGFPKPMNLNVPKMSSRARSINQGMMVGGTRMLQDLMDTNSIRQEQEMIAIYKKQIDELAKSIEETSKGLTTGSVLNVVA